jgi:hypothetical protein
MSHLKHLHSFQKRIHILTANVTVPLLPPRFLLLQSLDSMAKKAELDLNLFKSGGAPPPAVAEKSKEGEK